MRGLVPPCYQVAPPSYLLLPAYIAPILLLDASLLAAADS